MTPLTLTQIDAATDAILGSGYAASAVYKALTAAYPETNPDTIAERIAAAVLDRSNA